MNGKVEQFSDAVDVLLPNFLVFADLGEFAETGDEGISNVVDFEVTTDSDGVHKALKAEVLLPLFVFFIPLLPQLLSCFGSLFLSLLFVMLFLLPLLLVVLFSCLLNNLVHHLNICELVVQVIETRLWIRVEVFIH